MNFYGGAARSCRKFPEAAPADAWFCRWWVSAPFISFIADQMAYQGPLFAGLAVEDIYGEDVVAHARTRGKDKLMLETFLDRAPTPLFPLQAGDEAFPGLFARFRVARAIDRRSRRAYRRLGDWLSKMIR